MLTIQFTSTLIESGLWLERLQPALGYVCHDSKNAIAENTMV